MKSLPNYNPSLSILLVEDDNVTLELLCNLLAGKYCDVIIHTAANGKEGLKLFKVYKPNIVITDINMPEMCGLQLANEVRAIKPDTQIISISAKTIKNVANNSTDKSVLFDHAIEKPVCLHFVFTVIEQCFDAIAQQK